MTSQQKGKRNEKKTKDYFEKIYACRVENTKSSSSYRSVDGKVQFRRTNNDFFGLWDHVCISTTYTSIPINGHIGLDGKLVQYNDDTVPTQDVDIGKGLTFYAQTKSNELPNYFAKAYRQELVDFPADIKLFIVWKDRVKKPLIYLIH